MRQETPRSAPLHRPRAVWLALCVALVMALAPTLSHAVAWMHSAGGSYVEICTASGPRMVALDAVAGLADSTPGPESSISLSHCSFCLQATDHSAPAPHPLPNLSGLAGVERVPPVWQVPLYATPHTVTPPPRGPPLFA